MHAVHLTVTFTDRSAGVATLDQVVPRTSDLPGFTAGYWLAGPADFLKNAPEEAGVTLDREGIWVGEVLAHA